MNICEVRNLSKDYPSFSLKDVSFSLSEGTITGFIGRNGAGKTTTIKSTYFITTRSFDFGIAFICDFYSCRNKKIRKSI